MKKLDLRLFRMIKNTKGQYIAVLAIIITGIFIFTAVSNSSKNLKDSINDYYAETNFADIFVQGLSIPEKIERELPGTNNIKQADARIVFDTHFITEDKDENVKVRVVSVDKNQNLINKLFIKSGDRTLSNNKDIIIIEKFAEARNIFVGDTVKLRINGRQQEFNVIGIATSSEFAYMMENEQTILPDPQNFGVVFLEENYLRKIHGINGNFNEILIKVKDENYIEQIVDFLEDNLDKYGVTRIIKREDQLSNNLLSQEISGLEMMSKSIPVVFLSFAGVMLAVMLSRIVKKDRTSIGVLKALGFTDKEIVIHYLKYAAIVGLIGGFLGSIIGTALSGVMTNYYLVFFNIPMLTVKVYYYRIIISVILSLFFCTASGFLGVREIIKINPAESMKPEAPKEGKRIIIENIKIMWSHVPFTWKIVLRNIFREKKKFIFIGAAVAITCGMMIMTTWMIDIIDVMFNRHYSEFMKAQYNISFNGFTNDNVLNELSEQLSIDKMEGRTELPFEVENGRESKIVTIIGLRENTDFYGFEDTDGNRIKLPSNGVLISSNLAKSLNVIVGDRILIKSFISDKDVYVTVKGIVNQVLGINAYINIDYLNNMFLDKGIINGVYLNSKDNVKGKLDNMKNITIQSRDDMIKAFEEFTTVTAVSMGIMVVFSGILGFVIVYSMTLMSINERTLEFSSLRVMGFSKKEIFNMLVRENTIMTFIGIVAGIPVGLWLVNYMGETFTTDIYTMAEPVNPISIFVSIILTVIFVISAQLMTYAKIHKLDFMQALKSRIT
jgi:putative ABC transport system permease protein